MVLEMQKAVLPEVARNVAEPMTRINGVTIYGTSGAEVAGMAQNVPAVMKQTFDIVKNVTGVDMADVMRAETIDAKTNKNVKVDTKAPLIQVGE
jgi:flotillin